MIDLSPELQQHLPKEGTFDWLLHIEGRIHRQVKHRRTVEFEAGGQRYFLKVHRGCGWGEIFKDLFTWRLPIVSARPDWLAIERLHTIGILTLTVAGKGLRGMNPARRDSFVVTEALEGMISLEDLARDWAGLTDARRFELKRELFRRIAHIARTLHHNGMNHRDFYLCHFLVRDRSWKEWKPGDELELHLIDLHRAQLRARVPTRWQVKDLGGLLFSALDRGLTSGDLLRFIEGYRERTWREILRTERRFWLRVCRNAHAIYTGYNKREPRLPRVIGPM